MGRGNVLMNLQLPKYKELGQTILKEWTSDHGKRKHQKEEIANWTKRDDHRHHAVDALVIACTKQGYIQRINTLSSSETKDGMQKEIDAAKSKFGKNYDANNLKAMNEIVKNHSGKLTQLEEYLITEKPFKTEEVSKEAEKILISFKAGKKVTTNGVRKVKINGKKKIVQKDILIPRGALHEQSVYGVIKVEDKNKSIKYLMENPNKIISKKIQTLIEGRLKENDNESQKAIASLKKELIYLDEKKEQILEKASCFKDEYVIKYPIQNLKVKDVPFIVDEKIRALVKDRLEQHNNKEKEAFKNTLWFNEKKQIPILTVRCYTGLSAVEAIKKDENGKDIGFAVLGNNHHIAIYQDEEGKQVQHSCTFWNAVERKKFKIPIIIRNSREPWNNLLAKELPQSFLDSLPADNLSLIFSMQQNEMFVLGLTGEKFDEAISLNNKPLLSEHLYLVWSIANGDYWFRHHLETKNSDLKKITGAKESKRYFRLSAKGLFDLNPIKVRLNHLGEITKIGE
jgi:CRISPR-associated endonuclease Csn1